MLRGHGVTYAGLVHADLMVTYDRLLAAPDCYYPET